MWIHLNNVLLSLSDSRHPFMDLRSQLRGPLICDMSGPRDCRVQRCRFVFSVLLARSINLTLHTRP